MANNLQLFMPAGAASVSETSMEKRASRIAVRSRCVSRWHFAVVSCDVLEGKSIFVIVKTLFSGTLPKFSLIFRHD